MDWIEVTAGTDHDRVDGLCSQLEELGVTGFVINDEADVLDFLKNGKKYWDYVDDEVIARVRGVCSVQFYLEDSEAGRGALGKIRNALPEVTFGTRRVRDEDWENNWKQYYRPIPVGERLLIVPEWDEVPQGTGRIPLRLDPGLIFGTGAHATTRMCLEELEKHSSRTVLDLGCGSGILAIAALLLGAERACACDIDEKAPPVVMENAALNGIYSDRLKVFSGDVLSDRRMRAAMGTGYDLVLANIVADVIIPLCAKVHAFMDDGGVFICSGIIDGREGEVRSALEQNGFETISSGHIDNWHCFAARPRI